MRRILASFITGASRRILLAARDREEFEKRACQEFVGRLVRYR